MEQAPRQPWILKPSVSNKGAEVQVVGDFADVRDTLRAWPDAREWVLQAYVARPVLFQGRKFHLRAYVLAVGDLRVYLWRRVLLLSSAVRYVPGDLANQLAHITNTARQAEGFGDRFDEDACVHLLEDLVADLVEERGCRPSEARACVDGIVAGMEAVTGELFRALQGERTVFAPMPNCFELYGLDYLVSLPEENGDEAESGSGTGGGVASFSPQVHLLEVNPGPDFKQSGCRLRGVVRGLLEAALDVAVLGDAPPAEFALVYDDQAAGAGLQRAAQAGGGMRLLSG
jgi:tubulin---tyrosine ligase